MLLAGWARHGGPGSTAWLGLEAADNERGHFWCRLVEAMRFVDPDVGDNTLAALSVGMADVDVAQVLLGELAAIGPTAVVLDNLHVLTEARAH